MQLQIRVFNIAAVFFSMIYYRECTHSKFDNADEKYYLVNEAYRLAKDLFNQGRANYDRLKKKSLHTVDTFLDLVKIMNDQMARELRSAVLKFYKIKYFYDFTNYVISLEEIIDITEHCLVEPEEKLKQIRRQFHSVINNFEDVRNFDILNKCYTDLPDEVAAAHCILHQAVLFNETMHESLVTIVEIKTRQHAQDMNSSLYHVQNCLQEFVPQIFEQLLLDAYTDQCGYLKVVNASIADLVKDKWKSNETIFHEKWSPLVQFLKKSDISRPVLRDSLLLSLFAANLSTIPDLKNDDRYSKGFVSKRRQFLSR